MTFSKQRFCLDWSMPPSEADWRNLQAAGVSLVLLPLPFCDQTTLARLSSMGCKVVIRLPEGTYDDDFAPHRIPLQVAAASHACPVDAVILGVEPENGIRFDWGSPSWGQEQAYAHRRRFDAVRIPLQAQGFKVVSPGWTMRSISEDEQPQPGRTTWREIVTMPQSIGGVVSSGYSSADGCGVHLYGYGWDGPVDELRLKFALKGWEELLHQPIFVDELGITGNHTQIEKVRAYLEIADILLTHPLGRRVELLCPFVSNGDPGVPPAWDARFLITDSACYDLIGRWVSA